MKDDNCDNNGCQPKGIFSPLNSGQSSRSTRTDIFLLIFFSSSFRPLRLASLHSPVDPKVFLLLRTRNRIERLCFAHYSGYDVTSNRRRIVYRPVG